MKNRAPPSTSGRRPRLRKGLRLAGRALLVAVLVYAVAGFVSLRLSRSPYVLEEPPRLAVPAQAAAADAGGLLPGVEVLGAVSVHTGRSHDAVGTLADVAAAAERTGLDFVLLGDHPDPWMDAGPASLAPVREDGVLLVSGVELVIQDVGRVLITDLDTLPRRWDGDVESLLSRARADDSFVSIVHPRSPRTRESWKAPRPLDMPTWEAFDVSEMARLRQSEKWVGYHVASLLAGWITGRGEGNLVRLDREGFSSPAILAYDSARALGPLSLTGGVNHHPKARWFGHLLPPYDPFFEAVVNHVLVERPLSADPVAAWMQVRHALARGRNFVTLGRAHAAAGFDVAGTRPGAAPVAMGGVASWSPGAELAVRMPRGPGGGLLLRVLRNGRELGWVRARAGQTLRWPCPRPGVYRVEVYRAGLSLGRWRWNLRPWILANPVEFTADGPAFQTKASTASEPAASSAGDAG